MIPNRGGQRSAEVCRAGVRELIRFCTMIESDTDDDGGVVLVVVPGQLLLFPRTKESTPSHLAQSSGGEGQQATLINLPVEMTAKTWSR